MTTRPRRLPESVLASLREGKRRDAEWAAAVWREARAALPAEEAEDEALDAELDAEDAAAERAAAAVRLDVFGTVRDNDAGDERQAPPAPPAEPTGPRGWTGRTSVYVAAEDFSGARHVKIGISRCPEGRFGSSTDNPRPIVPRKCEDFPSRDAARRVERYLHQRFSRYRGRGEWFGHAVDDIDAFAETVEAELAAAAEKERAGTLPAHAVPIADEETPARWWKKPHASQPAPASGA